MKSLTIIRGLPGSGKTTTAKELISDRTDCVLIEADDFFMIDGEYKFDKSKIAQAHAWCLCETLRNLRADKQVIVANTFCQLWEMSSYREIAVTLGIDYNIITCRGNYQSTHGIPPDALEAMRSRWEEE